MGDKAIQALLVEDNEDHVELISRAFSSYEGRNFELQTADTLSAARSALSESTPDLMIVDYRLPDGEGVELLPGNLEDRVLPIIVMTGHGDQDLAVNALKAGAIDYVVKSETTMANMANICERALHEWRHICERRQALHQLSIREAQIISIFQAVPTGIGVAVERVITDANEHLCDLLGYSADELIGRDARMLYDSDAEFERVTRVKYPQIEKTGAGTIETRFLRKDGKSIDVWLGFSAIDPADLSAGVTFTALDISQRKEAEKQVRFMASHDSLTGLANRSLFMDRLSTALAVAKRHRSGAVVMFVDLDDFKAVNDSMGHEAGDDVLKQAATRIETCLRESDSTARFGGDEFLALLPMTTNRDAAAGVAAKIIDSMSHAFAVNGGEVRLGCSIGIALFPEHGNQSEDLISQADAAMYAAKKSGKNSYQYPPARNPESV